MAGALREILAKFGYDVDSSKLDAANAKTKEAKQKLKDFASMAKTVAGVLAAGVFVSAVRGFIGDMQEQGNALKRTSQQLGLGTHELQKWQTAADLAGVDAEGLAVGIKFLQKNAEEAADKGGDAAAVFKKLGVSVKDASGQVKPTGDLLRETGLAIGAIKNPSERTAQALKVFGRQGLSLIPIFNKGADGLDELLGELDRLGGGISDDAIAKLAASRKAGKQFDVAVLSLKSSLAAALVPALTKIVNVGTSALVWFQKAAKGTEILKGGFIAVTAAIIAMNAPAIATAAAVAASWLPVIATVLIAGLVVDDFLTFMKGGKSVIGDFFEAILGESAMARVRSGGETLGHAFITAVWRGIKRGVTLVIDLIGTIFTGAAFVGEGGVASEGEKLGQDFVNAIVNGIKTAINGVGHVFHLGDLFDTTPPGGGAPKPPVKYDVRGNPIEPTPGVAPAGAAVKYDVRGNPYTPDTPPAGSALYAPGFTGSKFSKGGGDTHITQQNTITVPISTTGSAGEVAGSAKTGINAGLNDSRRAMLHALEPVAPGGN